MSLNRSPGLTKTPDLQKVTEVGATTDQAIVSTAAITMDGTFTMNGTPLIITDTNTDLTLLPNGTGVTIIGDAGSPTYLTSPTNDDFFVNGRVEIVSDGFFHAATYHYGKVRCQDSVELQFGDSADVLIDWNLQQSNHSLVIGVGNTSRTVIICEKADIAVNYSKANQVDPTIFLQSADATDVTQWGSFAHNQTDFVIRVGSGGRVTNHEAPTEIADEAEFNLPANSAGFGTLIVGDAEEYAQFIWDSTEVVTLVANSANVVATDTDTKFCIFDNTGKVSIKNRLGAAKKIMFDYHYTTP